MVIYSYGLMDGELDSLGGKNVDPWEMFFRGMGRGEGRGGERTIFKINFILFSTFIFSFLPGSLSLFYFLTLWLCPYAKD